MAFELDDLDPRNAKKKPLNLDDMNIEDLKEYAAAMRAEIERVEAKIRRASCRERVFGYV